MSYLKILVFVFVFLVGLLEVSAQKNDVRLNFGFQANLPERIFNDNISDFDDKNGGYGFHFYPKWFYSNNVCLGVDVEYALLAESTKTDVVGSYDVFSVSPVIEYYLTNFKIRPFVGLGCGLYHVLYQTPNVSFGVRPIVGVAIFNVMDLSLEYSKVFGEVNAESSARQDFSGYYVAVKASFSVGIGAINK